MKIIIKKKSQMNEIFGFGAKKVNPKFEEDIKQITQKVDSQLSPKFKKEIGTTLAEVVEDSSAAWGLGKGTAQGAVTAGVGPAINLFKVNYDDIAKKVKDNKVDSKSANLFITGMKEILESYRANVLSRLSEEHLNEILGMKQADIQKLLAHMKTLPDNQVSGGDSDSPAPSAKPPETTPTNNTKPEASPSEDPAKNIDPKKMEQRFQIFKQNAGAIINNIAEVAAGVILRIKPAAQPAQAKPVAPPATPATPPAAAPTAAPATTAAAPATLKEIAATTPENAVKIFTLQLKQQMNNVLSKITVKDFQEAYVAVAKTKFKNPAELQKAFKSMRMLQEEVQGVQSTEYQLMDILFKLKGPKGKQRGQEGLMFTVLSVVDNPAVNLTKVFNPAQLETIRASIKTTFNRVMGIGNAGNPNQQYIANPRGSPQGTIPMPAAGKPAPKPAATPAAPAPAAPAPATSAAPAPAPTTPAPAPAAPAPASVAPAPAAAPAKPAEPEKQELQYSKDIDELIQTKNFETFKDQKLYGKVKKAILDALNARLKDDYGVTDTLVTEEKKKQLGDQVVKILKKSGIRLNSKQKDDVIAAARIVWDDLWPKIKAKAEKAGKTSNTRKKLEESKYMKNMLLLAGIIKR